MKPVIWLDDDYAVPVAAELCGVPEGAIRWAVLDGRLKANPDGTIPGIELFKWFKYRRTLAGVAN